MTTTQSQILRSDELRTKRDAARTYLSASSPRILLAGTIMLWALRIALGGWGRGDIVGLVATVALIGPVEWCIHLFLLHAPETSFRMRKLETGTGHRKHHLDPTDLEWLLLAPLDAAIFLVMVAGLTAAWAVPLMWLTGSDILLGFLTGYACSAASLAHYEWVHLLVHTRYRSTSRYYARLTRNHRLHHYRNENHWLGVTMNSGDRIMRTFPKDKTDVPLSETARTLS